MITRLVWTIWTPMSAVPKKAVKGNHSLTHSLPISLQQTPHSWPVSLKSDLRSATVIALLYHENLDRIIMAVDCTFLALAISRGTAHAEHPDRFSENTSQVRHFCHDHQFIFKPILLLDWCILYFAISFVYEGYIPANFISFHEVIKRIQKGFTFCLTSCQGIAYLEQKVKFSIHANPDYVFEVIWYTCLLFVNWFKR